LDANSVLVPSTKEIIVIAFFYLVKVLQVMNCNQNACMGPPCGLSCPARAVRFRPLGVPD